MSNLKSAVKLVFVCAIVVALLASVVGCATTEQPTAAPAPTNPTAAPAPASSTTPPALAQPTATPAAPKATATAAQAAKPIEMLTLKVGSTGSAADAGLFIALDKGYFKDQGLDVQLENFPTTSPQVPLLATGKLDIGVGVIAAGLFNATNRDIPIKMVAEKGTALPGRSASALCVRKDVFDAGWKDYSDLKGRTVAIAATGSGVHIELTKALEMGGLTEEDIELVTMPFPDMNVAFNNKAIDAALFQEPLTTMAVEKDVVVRWKLAADIYPNHTVAVVLYGPEFPVKHPEAAKNFMVAYLKGVRDYNDAFLKDKNKAEIISIMTKNTTVKDAALYERMMPAGLNSNGYVNVEGIKADLDWYVKNGFVTKDMSISDIVDQQYVDYAVSVLGKVD